jgi:hypothetical protein
MKQLQSFVSERSPAKASEVTRLATASCQDIGDIVVMTRKLSGDRGDGKQCKRKGLWHDRLLPKHGLARLLFTFVLDNKLLSSSFGNLLVYWWVALY